MRAIRFPDAAAPAAATIPSRTPLAATRVAPQRPPRFLLSMAVLLALALCATDSTAGRQVARDAAHTDRPGGDVGIALAFNTYGA